MCGAATLFPFMNGIVQLLAHRYSIEQLVWARSAGHLLFMIALFAPRHGGGMLRTFNLKWQVTRSILLLGSTALFFSAVPHLALPKATSITFTAPFIVTLMAWPLLGERISLPRFAAVLVGFAGVLIVIRPGSDVFQWAAVLVLGSATFYGLYQIATRHVAGLDHPATSAIYSALVGTIATSAVVPFSWTTPDRLSDVLLLMGLGVLGGLGHYCIARAMTYAPASVVSPFQYWQMIGAVLVGFLIGGQLPDGYTWLGAAIIIAAGLFVGWLDTREPSAGRPVVSAGKAV